MTDIELLGESEFRSDSNAYNAGTAGFQLIHEKYHAAKNWTRLNGMLDAGTARDIIDEPKKNGAPCIVIGSGASLELALPVLKSWHGGIMCTTSHALSLVYHGAPPSYIVALDPFCSYDEIKGVDWSKYNTKLITVPTVDPSLIDAWPNEILLYVQNNGRADSYYMNTLTNMYSTRIGSGRSAKFEPRIKTAVTLFACSPPTQMFIAQVFGYGAVFLSGCDFGYSYGKERFADWTVEDGNWVKHEHPLTIVPKLKSNNGILTDDYHLFYKKNMISAWRLSMQDVWTTDHGTITEMPFINMKTVIKKNGILPYGLSAESKIRASETYLASVGAFTLNISNGMIFAESKDPEKELVDLMVSMKRQYLCKRCGADLTRNDDTDMEEHPCPKCGGITMVKKHSVDIEANMNRIRSYL